MSEKTKPEDDTTTDPPNTVQIVSHGGETRLFINGMPIQFASLTLKATPECNELECVFAQVGVELVALKP